MGEQCDDGNIIPADGCDQNCQVEPVCGNGAVENGEQCDDGNTAAGDGCNESCQLETTCGDGIPDPPEQCDDANQTPGDGCDENCRIETTCGDGVIEIGERCDDGNTRAGDGCNAICQVESTPESESNEDGTPSTGGFGIDGNDFDSSNADGPFSSDTIIAASLNPAGDEDVFAISNTGSFATSVRFDTYNAEIALGVACGTTINTGLNIRDASGTILDFSDDRAGSQDRCSGMDFIIQSGETVYAHVTDFGDNSQIAEYFLDISFATCGDGVIEGLEQCDDGNNVPGDGCSEHCVTE